MLPRFCVFKGLKQTNAAGETTLYTYGQSGRNAGYLESITHPDGAVERFMHDAEGRLLTSTSKPHEHFPNGLCLIAKVPLIDFDIRGHSIFFHIVSRDFFNLMKELDCEYEDAKPIKVVSPKGKSISTKEYFVVIFKRYKISDIMDMSKTELFPRKIGDISDRIRKFKLKEGFDKNIASEL